MIEAKGGDHQNLQTMTGSVRTSRNCTMVNGDVHVSANFAFSSISSFTRGLDMVFDCFLNKLLGRLSDSAGV